MTLKYQLDSRVSINERTERTSDPESMIVSRSGKSEGVLHLVREGRVGGDSLKRRMEYSSS